MEEDLIVVDDDQLENNQREQQDQEQQPEQETFLASSRAPKTLAEQAMASSSRLRNRDRNVSNPQTSADSAERTTRGQASRAGKPQPRLKLKLSEKAAAQAPGMSFLGPYDRELDSDDEDLAFEEQFILRMPPGEDCEKLRKMIQTREVTPDVWFKFKDSRRAIFHIGNNTYSGKLVDLPCVVEGQKTLDNKQMFKVADICQMLVVENRVESEDQAVGQRSFNIDEFIWPHGITPPLHWVRKRRFRQRTSRRAIESVEEEVERLLKQDEAAAEVKYEVLENVNPDLSDSEFIEREEPLDAATPAISDLGDGATPMGDDQDDGEDGDIDEELAAELDQALVDEEPEDDDDDESEEEDDEDEDEDDETSQSKKRLNEEIRDLEGAVAKKRNDIANASNPLIKKRFEDMLKKLTLDLEMKIAQRDEMSEIQRRQRTDPTNISSNTPDPSNMDKGGDDDDLFGSDDDDGDDEMDIA